MEKNLSYDLMLPLKEIALKKVVIILWSQTDILSSLDKCRIKYQIEVNIKKLELPPALMEQMIYFEQHITEEILNWRIFHEHYLKMSYGFDLHILQLLFWTNSGTIDYRKSAVKLIRHKIFDTVKNYRLASLYCLDDHIPILWEQLPEENKIYFYQIEGLLHAAMPNLEFCWPYILEGKENKLINVLERFLGISATFNQFAFEYSALKGNKAATEYFFRKLTEVEKEASLFRISQTVLMKRILNNVKQTDFPRVKISDTFCYLLPLMSANKQMAIFQECRRSILICFLDWPRQNRFLDIAKFIWNFLTTIDYVYVLEDISMRMKSDYYLSKLFQEFFLMGSDNFRKCFVNRESQFPLCFRALFNIRDSETIKLIFRSIECADRKKLAFSERLLKLFEKDIQKGDWNLVELCLEEATLSTEDKKALKDTLSRFAEVIQEEEIDL